MIFLPVMRSKYDQCWHFKTTLKNVLNANLSRERTMKNRERVGEKRETVTICIIILV